LAALGNDNVELILSGEMREIINLLGFDVIIIGAKNFVGKLSRHIT